MIHKQRLKGFLTWRRKLTIVGLIPVLVGALVGFVAGHMLFAQNNSMQILADRASQNQLEAASSLTAVLAMQIALQRLIASAEESDIRTAAIEAIKATSAAEESLTMLNNQIPDNSLVMELNSILNRIKPS